MPHDGSWKMHSATYSTLQVRRKTCAKLGRDKITELSHAAHKTREREREKERERERERTVGHTEWSTLEDSLSVFFCEQVKKWRMVADVVKISLWPFCD
jgi:hypothetical protein